MDYISEVINVIGLLMALGLIFVTIKFSKTLFGSFFPAYSRWRIFGAVCFGLGFVFEFLSMFGITEALSDGLHHALLIIAGIVVIRTSDVLPKMVNKFLLEQQKK